MIHIALNIVIVCFAVIGFSVVAGVAVGYVLQVRGRDED